jgi:hypothetical protein
MSSQWLETPVSVDECFVAFIDYIKLVKSPYVIFKDDLLAHMYLPNGNRYVAYNGYVFRSSLVKRMFAEALSEAAVHIHALIIDLPKDARYKYEAFKFSSLNGCMEELYTLNDEFWQYMEQHQIQGCAVDDDKRWCCGYECLCLLQRIANQVVPCLGDELVCLAPTLASVPVPVSTMKNLIAECVVRRGLSAKIQKQIVSAFNLGIYDLVKTCSLCDLPRNFSYADCAFVYSSQPVEETVIQADNQTLLGSLFVSESMNSSAIRMTQTATRAADMVHNTIVVNTPVFQETAERVRTAASGVHGITEQLRPVLERAECLVGASEQTVERVNDILSDIGQKGLLSVLFPSIGAGITSAFYQNVEDYIARCISFSVDAIMGSYPFTPEGVSRFLLRWFADANMASLCVDLYMKYYGKHIDSFIAECAPDVREAPLGQPEETRIQSLGSSSGFALLSALVGSVVLGTVPDFNANKTVIEGLRAFNLAVPACKNLGDLFTWFLTFLPETIQAWVLHISEEDRWIYEVRDGGKFKIWHDDVVSTCIDENFTSLHYDNVLQCKILQLDEDGKKLLISSSLLSTSPATVRMHSLIGVHLKTLSKFVTAVKSSRQEHSDRLAPFSIYIGGVPGIGKSQMSTALIKALCPPSYPEHCIYDRASHAGKFWDGYHGQPVVKFDDFFQNADSEDVAEYINLNTSAPYRLPMASVDDPTIGIKGQISKAEIIVACSNALYPEAKNRSIEALWRRRHILIDVQLREEMRVEGRPDVTKFGQLFEHLYFLIRNPLYPTLPPVKRIDTFPDLIEYVVLAQEEYKIRETRAQLATRISMKCAQEIRAKFTNIEHTLVQGDTVPLLEDDGASCLDVYNKIVLGKKIQTKMADAAMRAQRMWGEAIEPIEEALKQKRASYPRLTFALKIAGVVGAIALPIGLLFKYLRTKSEDHSNFEKQIRKGFSSMKDRDRKQFIELLHRNGAKIDDLCNFEPEANFMASGDEKTRATGRAEQRRSYKNLRAEGSTDIVASQLVASKISSQLAYAIIDYKYDDGGSESSHRCGLNGLFVAGSIIMLPYHFFVGPDAKLIPKGTIISLIRTDGTKVRIAFNSDDLVRLEGFDGKKKDCALYSCGYNVGSVSNIVDRFVSEGDLDKYLSFAGELVVVNNQGSVERNHCMSIEAITRPKRYSTVGPVSSEVFILVNGFEYHMATSVGYCGAPLVVHNPRVQKKIVGIHVCGSRDQDYGQSELVTCEQIQKGMKKFPCVIQGEYDDNLTSLEPLDRSVVFPKDSNLTYLGVLPHGSYPRGASVSDIVPSCVFDCISVHTTEPAPLTSKDPRIVNGSSPILTGTEKYGHVLEPMDPVVLQEALDYVEQQIKGWKRGSVNRYLTEEEAINGVFDSTGAHVPYFDSLNMQSSPGLPYVLTRKKGVAGKQYLFSGEPGKYVIRDDVLRTRLDALRQSMDRGVRPFLTWTGQLKDERRSLDKIAQGKTRLFVFPPVEHTIEVRALFLAFNACFYANRIESFSAVGIDPQSLEWHRIATKLLSNSDLGIAGDFSNYDGQIPAEVMGGIVDIIDRWYDDGRTLARRICAEEWIHTNITCLNLLYTKHIGNPSGCPLTVVINTIANAVYMAYCWLKCAPLEKRDLIFFDSCVRMFAYGDDNIISIKEEALPFYNMETISVALASFGQKYTPPNKGEYLGSNADKVLSHNFLKHSFHQDETTGIYVAQLDKNTIHEMINWVHKSPSLVHATLENIGTALRYMFFYGRDVYNLFRSKLLGVFVEKGIKSSLPTFDYYSRIYGENLSLPVLIIGNQGFTLFDETMIQADHSRVTQSEGEFDQGINITQAGGITDLKQGDNVISTIRGVDVTSSAHGSLLPDPNWTFDGLVERKTVLYSGAWAKGDPLGKTLWGGTAPWDMILTSSCNHLPFGFFTFWRGKIRVEIQINGTKFNSGRLLLSFAPMVTLPVFQKQFVDVRRQSALQHVVLDPAINTPATLEIPFFNPKNAINLEQVTLSDFLGTMALTVLAPLAGGASDSETIGFTVLVSYHTSGSNGQFSVPIAQSPLGVPGTTYNPWVSGSKFVVNAYLSTKKRAGPIEETIIQGNTFSYNNNFKNVTSAVLGAQRSTGQDFSGFGAGSKNSVSTLDKPSMLLAPVPVIRSPLGYFSNSTNFEYLESMAFHPVETLSTPETFTTDVDEMDILYLCKQFNYSSTFTWSTTDAVNAVLWNDGIGPCSTIIGWTPNTFGPPSLFTERNLITLDYISCKFSFWSGTLRYRVEVCCSAIHSGRLFFGAHFGTSVVPSSLTNATSQYGVYLDLNSGQKVFDIDVPFESNALRRVCTPDVTVFTQSQYFTGRVSLRVVNPLSATADVASSVSINIWRACGDDYRLYACGYNNLGIIPFNDYVDVPPPPSSRIKKSPRQDDWDDEYEVVQIQGEYQGATSVTGKMSASVVPSSAPSPDMYRDCVMNVGDVIKRYCRAFALDSSIPAAGGPDTPPPAYNYNCATIDVGALLFRVPKREDYVDVGPSKVYLRNCGLFSYFGAGYAAYRGDIRFKLVHNGLSIITTRFFVSFEPLIAETGGAIPPSFYSSIQEVHKMMTNVPDWAFGDATTGGTSLKTDYVGLYSNASPAFSVSDNQAQYNLVEIPFISSYKFLMIPQAFDSPIAGTNFATPGAMYIAATENYTLRAGVPPTTAPPKFYTNAMVAAGDGFRFAGWLGPPIVTYFGV